jgi:hypothetical protein
VVPLVPAVKSWTRWRSFSERAVRNLDLNGLPFRTRVTFTVLRSPSDSSLSDEHGERLVALGSIGQFLFDLSERYKPAALVAHQACLGHATVPRCRRQASVKQKARLRTTRGVEPSAGRTPQPRRRRPLAALLGDPWMRYVR